LTAHSRRRRVRDDLAAAGAIGDLELVEASELDVVVTLATN